MLQLFDLAQDSYNQILAIVNYICFGSVCFCVVVLFVAILIARLDWWYKHIATAALIALITLFVVHFWLLGEVGIPLIVPPVDTIYFTEFMHIIQYIVTITVVVVGAYIFGAAALKLVDEYQFGKAFMSGLFYLILMLFIHGYFEQNFGIKLIFPPNLW